MNAQATGTINCPPEQVFDRLIDVEHHMDWVGGMDEITDISENPVQMGSTWQQRASFMGRDLNMNAKVNVLEPGQVFGFDFDKPFPAQMTFTLEPQAGGTKVTISTEFEPGGFFKLAGPVLSKTLKGSMEKDLQSLKANLEKA